MSLIKVVSMSIGIGMMIVVMVGVIDDIVVDSMVTNWVEVLSVVRVVVWDIGSMEDGVLLVIVWINIMLVIISVVQFSVVLMMDVIVDIVVSLMVFVVHDWLSVVNVVISIVILLVRVALVVSEVAWLIS